jgi:putative peptidoglycan lipid II flippase
MRWGHESLALTTSISATINFLILYFAMRGFVGDIGTAELSSLLLKLSGAGAAMAAVCLAANRWFFMDPAHLPFWIRTLGLMVTVGVAGIVYFAAARILRVAEAKDALEMITRRLRG